MSADKKHRPRLGRGLSSLMGQPVQITPPESPSPGVTPLGGISRAVSIVSDAGVAGSFLDVEGERIQPGVAVPLGDRFAENPVLPRADGLVDVPVTAIVPNPHQPREVFEPEALARLAESIKTAGLMQPIIIRPRKSSPGGSVPYELVAGERRWRAAQLAGLGVIPAIVRELDDQSVAEWALIENLQREDLHPLERAHAFRELIDNFKMTQDQIAQRLGLDRSTVANLLRLLNLHKDVQDMIRHGLLSGGQARALAGVVDPLLARSLAERAVRGQWSVRRVEAEVRAAQADAVRVTTADPPQKARAAHLQDVEQQITHQLGMKVRIRSGRRKGSGSLTIAFANLDQFDQIMAKLGVSMD